jgi:hypothetical protein
MSTVPRFRPPPRRTQHADFLALRSPVCFAPRCSRPLLHRIQPKPCRFRARSIWRRIFFSTQSFTRPKRNKALVRVHAASKRGAARAGLQGSARTHPGGHYLPSAFDTVLLISRHVISGSPSLSTHSKGRPTDRRDPFLKQGERGLDEWDGRGLRPSTGSSRQTPCCSLLTGEKAARRAGLRRKTHVISLACQKRTFAQRKK